MKKEKKDLKILTVSASPYLLARNGKINAAVLKYFKSQGYQIASAVWHHDDGYFLPDTSGIHTYEYEGEAICELHPFIVHPELSSSQIYEIMKVVQPDVVISIGDYKDTDYIYAVKSMHPNLFKWIAVFTIDCPKINELHKDYIEYADKIISTSDFGSLELGNLCQREIEFLPFGPNHEQFYDIGIREYDEFKIVNMSKNAQVSNIGAFVSACGQLSESMKDSSNTLISYLHTNLFDPGDYDIDNLIDRYAPSVRLPTEYISIKEGISVEELNRRLNEYHCIVDCSVKSATALSLLEGMASGCVPVGIDHGRVGEIISMMPKEFQFFVPHEIYIGKNEEEFGVISINGLVDRLALLRNKLFVKKEKWQEASKSAQAVAKKFSESTFVVRMSQIVQEVSKSRDAITVESF